MKVKSRRCMALGRPIIALGFILTTLPVVAQSLDGLVVLGPARAVANARQGAKVRACAPGVSALPASFTHLRTPPAETPRAVALGVCDVMVVPEAEAEQATARLRALGVDVDGAGGMAASTPTGSSFAASSGAGSLPGFVPGGRSAVSGAGASMPGSAMQAPPVRQLAASPQELPAPRGLDPTAPEPIMPAESPAPRMSGGTSSAPRMLSAPRGADAPVRSTSTRTVSAPRELPAPRGLGTLEERPLGTVGTPASRARVEEAQEYFHSGYDALQRNRLDYAADQFEQGLQLSPYNWLGLFYLAQTYDRMGRVGEAIPLYDQVIDLSPRSPEATFARDRMRREGYTPRMESGSSARFIDEPVQTRRPTRRLDYEPKEPPERSVKEIFEGSEGAAYLRDVEEREAREKALPPLPRPISEARRAAAAREGVDGGAWRGRLASLDDGNRFTVGTRLYAERAPREPAIVREPVMLRDGPAPPPTGYAQPEQTRLRLQSSEDSDGSGRVSTRLGAERPIRIVRTATGAARPVDEPRVMPAPAAAAQSWGAPQPPPGAAAFEPIVPAPEPPTPLGTGRVQPVETVPMSEAPPPAPMVAPEAMVPPPAPVPLVPEPVTPAPVPPTPIVQSMTLAFPDGSRYVGEVGNGRPDGQGTLTYADGTRYTGGFVAGRRGGRGSLTLASGWRYEGDFVNDQPNGRGVMTQPDGTVYDGDFQAGRRTGNGTLTLPNGEKYAGAFVDGMPEGRGTYQWPDGHRFEGDFRAGSIDGNGVMSYPGGRTVSGLWRNRELVRPL